jgi:Na+-driven multidrug efflux pump
MSNIKQTAAAGGNPLAIKKISALILQYAIPATVSNLVSALYNIVDQIFIGRGVGMLGNAATNVAFPLTTICTGTFLLIGTGSAANFNLNLGAGNKEKASHIAGTGISLLAIFGVFISVMALIFLEPLLRFFGATAQVLPYALTYTGITAFGIPFLIFSAGASQLIRADGSPAYSMICVLVGAIMNTILDPILIFGFNMGMAGAAIATVASQIISCLLVIRYLTRFKTFQITKAYLKPVFDCFKLIMALGAAACFNQLAMTVSQIVMNNTLTHYGALSQYGTDIPLACVGVITKVHIVIMAFILGTSQGCQPIFGFNYGAGNFKRVKETMKRAFISITCITTFAFACFQLFPTQIISIFGQGNEMYFKFAERYFRIFMFMTFLFGTIPLAATFFTSIGKAPKGIFLSLTRQFIFLIPLVLILPAFMGIDGVMYAGPIADCAAIIVGAVLISIELKKMVEP